MHYTTPPLPGQNEAQLVAESARRVAAGNGPLQRMTSPTLAFQQSGELFVYLEHGQLQMSYISLAGGIRHPTTTDIANEVKRWNNGVIFADRSAFAVTLGLLKKEYEKLTIDAICYTMQLALNGRYTILTDALATRYVAPGAPGSLETWREAFHIGKRPMLNLLVALAAKASDGENLVFPNAVSTLQEYGGEILSELSKGWSRAIQAYKVATRHSDLWNAVQHSDSLLRDIYLATGDTISVTPLKMLGGRVECKVSTPFKIRPGSSVVIWQDGGTGLPATFVDLGFDPESESLTGHFAPPTAGKTKRNGYDMLFDSLRSPMKMFVTTQPFVGGTAKSSMGSGPLYGLPSRSNITRDLPLFVSLAAAATPNSREMRGQ